MISTKKDGSSIKLVVNTFSNMLFGTFSQVQYLDFIYQLLKTIVDTDIDHLFQN